GWVWPRLEQTVREAVRAAAKGTAPFDSAITDLGVFPTPSRARVVWAGVHDPEDRLAALAARLDELLEEDFAPESRPFPAHLPLARLAPPRNVREFAPDLVGASVESESFRVDHLVL